MANPLQWPVLRQFLEHDPTGRHHAAKSPATERLTARITTADRVSKAFTVGGAVGLASGGRHSRLVSTTCGLAVAAGSALLRFGLFEAGVASTRDPKYVVVPQRERADAAARLPEPVSA